MELTLEALTAAGIGPEQAEELLQAHEAALSALREERDEAAQALRAHQQAARRSEAHQAVRSALTAMGAHGDALPLLAEIIDVDKAELSGGRLTNAEGLLAPLRRQYPGLFGQQGINPPRGDGLALQAEDIRHMSTEDINRRWHAVKAALANREE